jgi:hypothetical protein
MASGVVHGLTLSRETLARGAEETLTRLIHEAAHVLAWTRGVKDTTPRKPYHGDAFRAIATELGLEWPAERERDTAFGYTDMRLSNATRQTFADHIKALDAVIPAALPDLQPVRARPKREARPSLVCQCSPPRRVWAAQSTFDQGPVICGICNQPFG